MNAGVRVLTRFWRELGGDPGRLIDLPAPPVVPLPSRLSTGDLAWASVAAAALASGRAAADLTALDPVRIALSYRSDRMLRIDGAAPSVWSPYSGFWVASDGWIRTHGNYPHHAAAMREALQLTDTAESRDISAALASIGSREACTRISGAGGLAVEVADERPEFDASLRERPIVEIQHTEGAPARVLRHSPRDRPLEGVRVLDLTRVIAGPVCTRTLALLGADVLRIDPPHLPEPEWQHLDTGHGKRSTLLDARSDRFRELLSGADVVVLGYHPSALARLGLAPDALAAEHPGTTVLDLSAWGAEQPARRGFDSLVQAESGIAVIESADAGRPGALPAQALDHSAGYLLAASAMIILEHRRLHGGSWRASTSLRRIAAELLGMPRRQEPGSDADIDTTPHAARFTVAGRQIVTTRPVFPWFEFEAPHPWSGDQPRW